VSYHWTETVEEMAAAVMSAHEVDPHEGWKEVSFFADENSRSAKSFDTELPAEVSKDQILEAIQEYLNTARDDASDEEVPSDLSELMYDIKTWVLAYPYGQEF
jgi:hypothetical protein